MTLEKTDTENARTGSSNGDETDGSHRGWSRRQYLGTTAGIGVGAALGVAATGQASADADGPTVYVGESRGDNQGGNLYAVDAATGEQEWAFTEPTLVHSSPTVAEGTVYVGSGSSESTALYAVDAVTGEREWVFEEPEEFMFSSPTVVDGTAYVGADDSTLYAVDAATGEREWAFRAGGRVNPSPQVVGGTVYIGAGTSLDTGERDSTVYAVDAETGDQEWTFTEPSDSVLSSPVVADGRLYVGSGRSVQPNDSTLYAVDADTGDPVWEFTEPETSIASSPTLVEGTIYVGSGADFGDESGNLYAVDAETGAQEWAYTAPEYPIASSPTVANGTVYVGDGPTQSSETTEDGTVHAVDAATGEQEWQYDANNQIFSSPTVYEGTVYVGSVEGSLLALDAATGNVTWRFDETNAQVVSSPTVVADPDGGSSVGSRVTLGTLGHTQAWPSGGPEPSEFGVDLDRPIVVGQGRDAGIPVLVTNNSRSVVSNATVELLVDTGGDGFTDGDVVAGQSVDLDEGESRTLTLPLEDVQIDAGEYPYAGRLRTDDQDAQSESSTLTVIAAGELPPPVVGTQPPTDQQNDGFFEDVNGDGEFSLTDVQVLFENRNADAIQDNARFFNFDGGDETTVTFADVRALFERLVNRTGATATGLGVDDPDALSPDELASALETLDTLQ